MSLVQVLPPQPKNSDAPQGCLNFFISEMHCTDSLRVFDTASYARWAKSMSAASGGSSEWILVQRSKKPRISAKRPTAFSGTANRREAITRRSLVQVLPPQPRRRGLRIVRDGIFMPTYAVSHSLRSKDAIAFPRDNRAKPKRRGRASG